MRQCYLLEPKQFTRAARDAQLAISGTKFEVKARFPRIAVFDTYECFMQSEIRPYHAAA